MGLIETVKNNPELASSIASFIAGVVAKKPLSNFVAKKTENAKTKFGKWLHKRTAERAAR